MKMIHVRDQVNDKIWLQSWILINRLISRQIKDLIRTKIKNQLVRCYFPIEIQIFKEVYE